jgi:hypothetical protein
LGGVGTEEVVVVDLVEDVELLKVLDDPPPQPARTPAPMMSAASSVAA